MNMDMIKNFPDVTRKGFEKFQLRQHAYQQKIASNRIANKDKSLTLFYSNEFRKWHITLALIIALSIAGLYLVIL